MDDFYAEVAEILEEDTVEATTVLRDTDVWDSLTALSLIAMIRQKYGVTVTADQMKASLTAGDLQAVVAAGQDG